VAPLVERFAVEKPNLGIGFLALFGFVGAAALRVAWRGTFHNLLAALAGLLDVSIVRQHPFGGLAEDLRRLDNHVYAWLGHLKDACGHSFTEGGRHSARPRLGARQGEPARQAGHDRRPDRPGGRVARGSVSTGPAARALTRWAADLRPERRLLDGLLADLLLVTSVISVVEFAKELQTIEGEVVSGLERFVREI
jgi:hypothetical protein